jgi:hypothetical protein
MYCFLNKISITIADVNKVWYRARGEAEGERENWVN